MGTKYIRNIDGGVHSIDEEFLEDRIKEDRNGRTGANIAGDKFLPHGWEEISEAKARKEHPHLFGAHDDRVVFNSKELEEMVKREQWLAQYKAATEPAPAE